MSTYDEQQYDEIEANLTDFEYEQEVAAYLYPNTVEQLFCVLLVSMMILGVAGNSLVVLVVVSKKTMWSSMNIFLTNLACADLLILLVCLPPTVINDVTKTFWFDTAFCKSMLFIQNTAVYVSIMSLVSVTWERWRAITKPLKPPVRSTKNIVIILWFFAIIASAPEPFTVQLEAYPFHRENFSTTWGTQCKETWSREFQRHYQLIQVTIAYIIPLIIISLLCISMSRTLNYCQLAIGKRQMLHRKKAVRMLLAVVILFALTNLPVHLYNIASSFDLLTPDEDDYDMNLIAIRKLLPRVFSYSSSCLNPVLYNFMCGKFRTAFARVICCGRKKLVKQAYNNTTYNTTSCKRTTQNSLSEKQKLTLGN